MEPISYLKDMFGIVEDTILDKSIDFGLGAAPYVGKLYQSYQMMKLQKRMTKNEKQLQAIKNKIESSANEVFYKQEIFPLIVKKLMEDEEDTKAKVIIDGFEYIIDNDFAEIERIYHYYDVLSELRYSDMMLLVDKYMPYEMRKNLDLKIDLVMLEDMDKTERKKYKEKEAIERYQINKLIRLGLIVDEILGIDGGDFILNANQSFENRTALSDFGKRFLEFFSLED